MTFVFTRTLWFSVKFEITLDWDIPKDYEMEEQEHEPMDYVFGFLLLSNFGSGVIELAITLIIISIHGTQEFLSCISLHIQIRCLHCLKLYCHRSSSRSSSKYLLGAEEGLTVFLIGQALVGNSLGVTSVGVSLNNNNDH